MPFDILSKVRQLLGGEKSQKRKASEESQAEIRKRFCEASARQPNYCMSNENLDRHGVLKKGRRYSEFSRPTTNYSTSNNMFNYGPSPAQSPHGSWMNKAPNFLNNGDSHTENGIDSEYGYQSQRCVPPLQPIQTTVPVFAASSRKVPSLIKPSWSNSQRKTSLFNRSTLPELYRIQRSTNLHNGEHSSAQNQRSGPSYAAVTAGHCKPNHVQPSFENFTAAQKYWMTTNSLSMKQNIDHHLKENGLISSGKKSPMTERNVYSKLINSISLTGSSKPKGIDAKDTDLQPQEIIDLASENDDSMVTTVPSRTQIEPVNTLQTRMETKPVYEKDFISKLNKKYENKSQSRSQMLQAEKERSSAAEQESQKLERSFLDRMKALDIDTVYDLAEDEEEEYDDFPALDDDQLRKIHQWLAGRDTHTQLISKFKISITRHDIRSLSWDPSLAWLNDEVINFYMELIAERSRKFEALPNVHPMNTFFSTRLLEGGYGVVRRWTRRVDILAQDIILVPVHRGAHWCMAIIHMRNKTIKYYDSLGGPNNLLLDALVEYLKAESMDKKQVAFDMTGWTTENVQNIPQQENGSDCGVFSCMYAEFIARKRPITFSQQHMQYFRKRMIYEICTGEMIV